MSNQEVPMELPIMGVQQLISTEARDNIIALVKVLESQGKNPDKEIVDKAKAALKKSLDYLFSGISAAEDVLKEIKTIEKSEQTGIFNIFPSAKGVH